MKRFIGWGFEQRGLCLHRAWGPTQWHTEAFWNGQKSVLWGFVEASLHYQDYLNHWPVGIDSTSSPLSGNQEVGLKFQPFNHMIGSPGNQPPYLGAAKSHLIHMTRQLYHSLHLRNSKGLWAVSEELWNTAKYIFPKNLNVVVLSESRSTLCSLMDCSTPGFPDLHHLPGLAQTHLHWVNDAIQPSHLLLPPSPPALNLSQHQGLFQWVSFLHQVAKALELLLMNFFNFSTPYELL